jgi:hypothetical protein
VVSTVLVEALDVTDVDVDDTLEVEEVDAV